MLKETMEGGRLLDRPPADCNVTGIGPTVELRDGLKFDDGSVFQLPTLMLGEEGSGKSSLMDDIINKVLPYVNHVRDNVVIFCAKPELLRHARPGDLIIDISSKDPKSCWNIFEEMDSSEDPTLTAREISKSLFREARDKTNNVFFPEAAGDTFFRVCDFMYDAQKTTGKRFCNADLVEFLETTPISGSKDIPGWRELAQIRPRYFSMMQDYMGSSASGSEQGLGVLAELRAMINSTMYGSFAARGTFSAGRALVQGGQRIFLHYDYSRAGQSTLPILQIILDLLLRSALQAENTHKTWFFLDEFELLPRSDVLRDALSFGRDPGANGQGGVRIMAAMQSARLMTNHYSQSEAEALLSLFPNVITFRVNDPISRRVVSDRYGKAHYRFEYVAADGQIRSTDYFEEVVSDWEFSRIAKKGQAIMSLPGVCSCPFIYDGYRTEADR